MGVGRRGKLINERRGGGEKRETPLGATDLPALAAAFPPNLARKTLAL